MNLLKALLIIGLFSVISADNSCIFEHPTKGLVNLTSVGLRNGRPRFQDVATSAASNFVFSFNPCYSFNENTCYNAAVCQTSSDKKYSFTLATQSMATWTTDSYSTPILTYVYGQYTVSITMICSYDADDTLQVLGEYSLNHFYMNLYSQCACWNKCTTPKSSSTTVGTSPATTPPSIYFNHCTYHDSRYGTIDLTSVGSTTGEPRFQDLPSSILLSNYVWSYNPCYRFTENTCRNVAGCQIDKVYNYSYVIGLQENAYWINMHNKTSLLPSIVYPSPINNRRLVVELICDQTDSKDFLRVIGEQSPGVYTMQLKSVCACWNGCSNVKPISRFEWNAWIIACIVVGSLFLCFLFLITCLFCTKPRRRFRTLIVNEKTPFFPRDTLYTKS